jgi:hypothetical protein
MNPPRRELGSILEGDVEETSIEQILSEDFPSYYNKEKGITLGELHKLLTDCLAQNPEVAAHEVLVDTEVRCFDSHMFGVSGVHVEGYPEKHLGLHLQRIESQRLNRDEHIDLVRICAEIEKLDVSNSQRVSELKAQATNILEYYRSQLV